MRKIQFTNKEYYHIFNRGVEKRDIFGDKKDLERFLKSMAEFNTILPVGGIYASSFCKINALRNPVSKSDRLVDFVCYCLCPNHYHFIIQQLDDQGIGKFMHRLGLGYAKYFNEKYRRAGSLFQGPYKARHIDSNDYLLHVSAYVNLNFKIHHLQSELFNSSWEEYFLPEENKRFCNRDIILKQFNNSPEYKLFAENSMQISRENKEFQKFLEYNTI